MVSERALSGLLGFRVCGIRICNFLAARLGLLPAGCLAVAAKKLPGHVKKTQRGDLVFVRGDSRVEMRRVEVLLTPKQVHAVGNM